MTNLDSRLIYENAKVALQKAFPDVPNIAAICKLTQSTLRLEKPIVAGNTSYTFPVLVNEQVNFPTESRLLQQDSAIVYQIGVFLAVGGATASNFRLRSYPSKEEFTSGTTAEDALSLYNGELSVTVNNDILVPKWDLFKHLVVPQSQFIAAAETAATPPVPIYPGQLDQINGGEDGFYPMEPNVVLIGSKNNVIKLDIPGGIATAQNNSRIVIILRSIIAQNSTVVS